MYSVSDSYKTAIQDNTRSFSWSGTITTTSGKVYPFENKDIVKGSGYVSRQCSGSLMAPLRMSRWASSTSLRQTEKLKRLR